MKFHMNCAVAAALFATIGNNPADAKVIRMVSVIYGTPEAGRTCDATRLVASLCDGKTQCDVDVGNTGLCGDPDFLSVKKAVFDFTCGRLTHRLVEGEYHVAKVSCD